MEKKYSHILAKGSTPQKEDIAKISSIKDLLFILRHS
jgi:hypothetical protein